jgi:hypothetical protein
VRPAPASPGLYLALSSEHMPHGPNAPGFRQSNRYKESPGSAVTATGTMIVGAMVPLLAARDVASAGGIKGAFMAAPGP